MKTNRFRNFLTLKPFTSCSSCLNKKDPSSKKSAEIIKLSAKKISNHSKNEAARMYQDLTHTEIGYQNEHIFLKGNIKTKTHEFEPYNIEQKLRSDIYPINLRNRKISTLGKKTRNEENTIKTQNSNYKQQSVYVSEVISGMRSPPKPKTTSSMMKVDERKTYNDKDLFLSPEETENTENISDTTKNAHSGMNCETISSLQNKKSSECLPPTDTYQMNINSNTKKLDIPIHLSSARVKTLETVAKPMTNELPHGTQQKPQKTKQQQSTNINGIIFSEATEFLRGIELRLPKASTPEILQFHQENNRGIFGNDSAFITGDKKNRSCNDKINLTTREYYSNFKEAKGTTIEMQDLLKNKTSKIHHYEEDILKENTIKCGLGTALILLRERGMLNQNSIDWAGRNSDKKHLPHQIMAKDALFSVDNEKNEQTMRIETALRQTDEYGRVLTAKEAFRELCYHFHGKRPSQNRHLKRVKEYINDITCKKRLTSVNESQRLGKIYEMQQKTLTPYIVLGSIEHT
jgi:hypothetical protein